MKSVLIALCLFISYQLSAQSDIGFDFSYDVQQVYEPLSLSPEEVSSASTIQDLNQYYKPSWIKKFISVKVEGITDGEVKQAITSDDQLSKDQKQLISGADIGTQIKVTVNYIPDNNLKQNDPKVYDFAFRVNPTHRAVYKDGNDKMLEYFKKAAFDKVPLSKFKQYQLSAVKFTIDESGQVTDAHIFESSDDEKVDEMLLSAVCSMPNWTPARYSDGTHTSQEFVLRAGDMSSCVVNLLDTRDRQLR